MMDIKQYTDQNYVPLNELSPLGKTNVDKVQEYRQKYMEIIQMDNFQYCNLIETPYLVKKRYSINVEIKDFLNWNVKDNDFILEIAKKIVKKEKIDFIQNEDKDKIYNKFIENKNDLTIITNWITENYKKIFIIKKVELDYNFPELNNKDLKFIKKYNLINQGYSINDYNDLNKTSYETGRKAMEKMTKLNLFRKEKISKKFVYKPTTKLIETLKGGV